MIVFIFPSGLNLAFRKSAQQVLSNLSGFLGRLFWYPLKIEHLVENEVLWWVVDLLWLHTALKTGCIFFLKESLLWLWLILKIFFYFFDFLN